MSDVSLLLREGVALQQQGRPMEAITRYDEALRANPASVDATYYRAAATCQAGDFAQGAAFARRALALDPSHAKAANLLGRAERALGRHDEALSSFARAVAIDEKFADAHANCASLLVEMGRFDEGLTSFERALALDPSSVADSPASALAMRAQILLRLGRAADALADLDKIASHTTPAILLLRGAALGGLERHAEALACFDRVLGQQPASVDACVGRGTALNELGRHDEALTAFERAASLKPDAAEAHRGRGYALLSLRRFAEAAAALEKAVRLSPSDVPALSDQGLALLELGRYDEALACFARALRIAPGYAPALTNRGLAFADTHRFDQAAASYRAAQASDPDFAEAHWHEAELLLKQGDYARGLEKYEWRWKARPTEIAARALPVPMWRGEALRPGTRVLLHAEQGSGDTIQFVRYAPLLAARHGAVVILEVLGALESLCQCLDGITVVGRGESLPPFDLHCPLLSLPLAFKTRLDSIPAAVPYLSAPADRRGAWRGFVPDDGTLRVGVCWSGNPRFARDHHRSMSLAAFAPILDVAGASFLVLNPQVRAEDRAALAGRANVRPPPQVKDFADTAAMIEQLDLVITTDTATAHLAGALGKPVWILLSDVADWRWLADRRDCPWYPTARLFRQSRLGDWASVVRGVCDELGIAPRPGKPPTP